MTVYYRDLSGNSKRLCVPKGCFVASKEDRSKVVPLDELDVEGFFPLVIGLYDPESENMVKIIHDVLDFEVY